MTKIYDCFLYNDEHELLLIRLQLLAPIVHKFVIVWSNETFTGLRKQKAFPWDELRLLGLEGRIELVELAALIGHTAWEKEAFSRNALVRGLAHAAPTDFIMVSDVDEIPRPSVLAKLVSQPDKVLPIVLGQDYYNFKFNYKLVHGLQAVWAGPVLCRFHSFVSAQQLRDQRWKLLESPLNCVEDAGWHFSFLTVTDDVSTKLMSFSHQEESIQSRREQRVSSSIAERQGFHDHLFPCSIWAVVPISSFSCPDLERLILEFPQLVLDGDTDRRGVIDRKIRHSVRRLCHYERSKILSYFGCSELVVALVRRLRSSILGAFRAVP